MIICRGNFMNVEYVEAIPDTSLMIKSGKTGYSFSEIISELIDNSIDAAVDNERIVINITISKDSVIVEDNGIGMNKNQLHDAVVLAKSNKQNQLGLYGLGLKTSCVCLGEKFIIYTARDDEKQTYKTWWDETEWNQKKEWSFPIETLEKQPGKRGTIVQVEKLRFKVGNKINQLRGDIGRRFAPFINRGMAEIWVNNEQCKALTPELMEDTKIKLDITTSCNETITGWVGLLKNSSQRGNYGFDTFRFGRMITYYDKIGFKSHPAVARVIGEIHLNHIPVTHNKREWDINSREYVEMVKLISEAIKPIIAESRKMANEKKIESVEKNRLEHFKEGLANAVKVDELKEFTSPEREVSVPGRAINSKTGELERIERRDKPDVSQKGTVPPGDGMRKRVPKKIQERRKYQVKVKGKKFDYTHSFVHLGERAGWSDYHYDEQKRELEIFTNIDFPAVHATDDRTFLAFIHIVEAISQRMMIEADADYDKYEEIKQILLRESSKFVAELRD